MARMRHDIHECLHVAVSNIGEDPSLQFASTDPGAWLVTPGTEEVEMVFVDVGYSQLKALIEHLHREHFIDDHELPRPQGWLPWDDGEAAREANGDHAPHRILALLPGEDDPVVLYWEERLSVLGWWHLLYSGYYVHETLTPTHWMPLPRWPERQTEGAQE